MSYIEKKFFKEGQNETANQIDIFKNKSTGDLLYRNSVGEEIIITPQGGLNSIINNLEPKYKVYTALLTQSGEGNFISVAGDGEQLVLGVTYQITDNPDNYDLTIYGAPNNNVGTFFVANQTVYLPYTLSLQLLYNTGAPVVTVLENTIGNVWFSYDATGLYYVNSVNLFEEDKTVVFTGTQAVNIISGTRVNDELVEIVTYDVTNLNNSDDKLQNTPIEIRVYN